MKYRVTIPKNIPVINSYRAVGIMLVMIAHFTCNITGFFNSPALPHIHNVGYVAIIVFFTISGFVIPWWLFNCKYTIVDYFRFVARRMIRIEPPFIIALLLAIAYTYVRSLSPYYNGIETVPSFRQILLQLGYLVPFFENERWVREAYWTLAVECQWYLAMGLIYPLFFHKNIWVRCTTYFIILIPCYMVRAYLLQFFPVLLMGTLLCSFITKTIDVWEYILLSAFYLIYIYLINGPLDAAGAVVIIPMLLVFSGSNNKRLNFIGNMSYSVYLMHSLTGTALVNYLSHIVTNPFLKILVVIAGILFTLISSYIFYILIEKTSHKLSLKIAVNEHELKPKNKS